MAFGDASLMESLPVKPAEPDGECFAGKLAVMVVEDMARETAEKSLDIAVESVAEAVAEGVVSIVGVVLE